METLVKLARGGLTIVLTIHQPRSDIFHMFDRLLLLARGKVAYFGDATKAVPYFRELGFECPSSYNPADFFIDLISEVKTIEIRNANQLSETMKQRRLTRKVDVDRVTVILNTWESHNFYESPAVSNSMLTMRTHKRKVYRSAWTTQFFTLWARQFVNISRDTTATFARALQTFLIMVSLII